MIKGGGGALLREKLVALASRHRVNVVDMTKLVSTLGQTFKLPVEVVPFGWAFAARQLKALGCAPGLRRSGDGLFVTDNGNYILDCITGEIPDPTDMEKRIKLLPAVVEVGLFIDIADTLVVGFPDRVEAREKRQSPR
jgi:ribose 5-phosphate isomerase A